MKKMIQFEMPTVEVVKFELVDVITTSNDCELHCDGYECGEDLGFS